MYIDYDKRANGGGHSGTPIVPIRIIDGVATITGNTFGTMRELDEDVTFELAEYDGDDLCEYHWTLAIGEDIASITWPEGMQWQGGNVPTINANKTYEVSIVNSLAVIMEYSSE